ncbi:MAG: ABC transporter permease [Deltaproteobacteria bacterium]|nr:MAG: ABC transporter permease [Deltaproteobacteria bacterium]
MKLKTAITRARRGLREDLTLYVVAVSSLAVAFLCLAATLLAVQNLGGLADHWGESRRMTVYLVDGARRTDVEQLMLLLDGLPEVRSVSHVSSREARDSFLTQTRLEGDLGDLPPDVFPASLEIILGSQVTVQRAASVAERVDRFGAVEDVETYAAWFGQLEALLATGRALVLGLAFLVGFCVLAVVGNTIRLALASRRREIEVMKLCGATDSFVRSPFVVEGAASGLVAAAIAIAILGVAFLTLRGELDGSLAILTGAQIGFLTPATIAAIILGGGATGALGSAVSLRRYLDI